MVTARIDNWKSLRQLVEMTLGTDQGTWWADPEFGSRFWILRQSGRIDEGMVQEVKDEAVRALSWLKIDGLIATSPEVTAKQTGKNRIEYLVKLVHPNGSTEIVEGVWNGL